MPTAKEDLKGHMLERAESALEEALESNDEMRIRIAQLIDIASGCEKCKKKVELLLQGR